MTTLNSPQPGQAATLLYVPLLALAEDLRRAAYAVRHAIYCEELGYEPLAEDGLEFDVFDSQALHILVQDPASGDSVATARLVFGHAGFPVEALCGTLIPPEDRGETVELSRYGMLASYRGRASLAVQTALFLFSMATAEALGMRQILFLTTPGIGRMLSVLSGARPTVSGPAVEHRGRRIPYVLHLEHLGSTIPEHLRDIYAQLIVAARTQLDAANFQRSPK